jgi:raffinose/stachyose/melibiose transport system substrate-binding protein
MKRMTRTLAIALTLFLAGGLGGVFAEGSQETGEAEPVEIDMLFPHNFEEWWRPLLDEYEAAHPNVTVLDRYNPTDYQTQIVSLIASDSVPDLLGTIKQSIPDWVDQGVLMDISDRPVADIMLPVAKKGMSYEGGIYGAPSGVDTYGIVYLDEMLEAVGRTELPQTLSELEAYISTVSQQTDIEVPFTSQAGTDWASGQYFLMPASEILDENPQLAQRINAGETSMADGHFDKVFDFLNVFRANTVDDPVSLDFQRGVAFFAEGNAAMMVHGQWGAYNVTNQIDSSIEMSFGPIPLSEDPADAKLISGVNEGLAINPGSENLDTAIEVFDYMTTLDFFERSKAPREEGQFRGLAPYEGYTRENVHPVDQDVLAAMETPGATVYWEWTRLHPASVQETNLMMQAYMIGDATETEVLESIQDAIDLAR